MDQEANYFLSRLSYRERRKRRERLSIHFTLAFSHGKIPQQPQEPGCIHPYSYYCNHAEDSVSNHKIKYCLQMRPFQDIFVFSINLTSRHITVNTTHPIVRLLWPNITILSRIQPPPQPRPPTTATPPTTSAVSALLKAC